MQQTRTTGVHIGVLIDKQATTRTTSELRDFFKKVTAVQAEQVRESARLSTFLTREEVKQNEAREKSARKLAEGQEAAARRSYATQKRELDRQMRYEFEARQKSLSDYVAYLKREEAEEKASWGRRLALAKERRRAEAAERGEPGGLLLGIGRSAASLAAATASVEAARRASGWLTEATEKASDLNEAVNKAQVTFGSASGEIQKWAKGAVDNIGQTEKAALDAAGTFGLLFKSAGIAEAESVRLTRDVVGRITDVSSLYNEATDEVRRAFVSGLAGETEPMRRFGVFLSESVVQAEALRLGMGKLPPNMKAVAAAQRDVEIAAVKAAEAQKRYGAGSVEAATAARNQEKAEARLQKALQGSKAELTEQQKVQARLSVIMKQTAIATGDYQRTAGEAANQTRKLKAEVEQLQTEIGQDLLPLRKDVTSFFSEMVKGASEVSAAVRDFVRAMDEAHGVVNGQREVGEGSIFHIWADEARMLIETLRLNRETREFERSEAGRESQSRGDLAEIKAARRDQLVTPGLIDLMKRRRLDVMFPQDPDAFDAKLAKLESTVQAEVADLTARRLAPFRRRRAEQALGGPDSVYGPPMRQSNGGGGGGGNPPPARGIDTSGGPGSLYSGAARARALAQAQAAERRRKQKEFEAADARRRAEVLARQGDVDASRSVFTGAGNALSAFRGVQNLLPQMGGGVATGEDRIAFQRRSEERIAAIAAEMRRASRAVFGRQVVALRAQRDRDAARRPGDTDATAAARAEAAESALTKNSARALDEMDARERRIKAQEVKAREQVAAALEKEAKANAEHVEKQEKAREQYLRAEGNLLAAKIREAEDAGDLDRLEALLRQRAQNQADRFAGDLFTGLYTGDTAKVLTALEGVEAASVDLTAVLKDVAEQRAERNTVDLTTGRDGAGNEFVEGETGQEPAGARRAGAFRDGVFQARDAAGFRAQDFLRGIARGQGADLQQLMRGIGQDLGDAAADSLYNAFVKKPLDKLFDRAADKLFNAIAQGGNSAGLAITEAFLTANNASNISGARGKNKQRNSIIGAGLGFAAGSVIPGLGNVMGAQIGAFIGGLFAGGGRPPVGRSVIVGEQGPELVTFDEPGTVYSAGQTRDMLRGGGGGAGRSGAGIMVNGPLMEVHTINDRADADQMMGRLMGNIDGLLYGGSPA